MAAFPYDERIRDDRVHGSLYTDPAVFADELERIWRLEWIAVGHASEVPLPGDYVLKRIAGEPAILAHGADGRLRLLFNRCAHRANQVCEAPRGNTRAFRCPYHGWTFSNSGELLGFPYRRGYPDDVDKSELGLGQVARVDTYQGFVFASLAAEGPTLREHLGRATDALDRTASFSPEGRIELTAGWLRHRVNANWKLVVENETDGYHPGFVHRSIMAVADTPLSVYTERSQARVRDLGEGHTELDLAAEHRRTGKIMGWFGSDEQRSAEYVAALREAHGVERADALLTEGPSHAMIWPNLFLSEIFVLIVEPVSAGVSIQHSTPLQFAGAERMNRRILRQFEGSVGPAGMLLADDSAMYERNHHGVTASGPEWLQLRRGLQREEVDKEGGRWSNVTDETSQRAIWRRYRRAMAEAA
jgi:phenylpropionate dioxygenase-like ring-hydroxylating dioxygenase large terminal subunit